MLVVAGLMFTLINLAGDPVRMLLPEDASATQVQELREQLGLNDPIWKQFLIFLGHAVVGNLGDSFHYREPALMLVLQRLPASLELLAGATLLTVILGVPLGIVAAVHRGTWIDRVLLIFSIGGISAPSFFVGIVLLLVFAVELSWLPALGKGTILHLVLPSASLALQRIAIGLRLVRSGMLDVLSEDYVRTARAKGLSERLILYKHALKNASLPFITVLGLQVGSLLTGAIVTERIFAWPGMGRLMLDAVERLDVPVVLAFSLVSALLIVIVNLFVDLSYAVLDPRVRLS